MHNPTHHPRVVSRLGALRTLVLGALLGVSLAHAQSPTFNTVVLSSTGSQPWLELRRAAVGDFNGDGNQDAFVADGSGALRFMRGLGNGTFARSDIGAPPISSSNVIGLPTSLLAYLPDPIDGFGSANAADFNGDGRLDLVSRTAANINWGNYSFLSVMINTGNDANGIPQFSTTHHTLPFWDVRSIAVGDLNSDGRPDVIIGGAYAQVVPYLNNGSGILTSTFSTSIMPNAGGPAVGVGVIKDVNGDGKGDYVVTSGQSNSTNVFLGNGNGTLQAPTVLTPAAITIAVADLNNDSRPDLIQGFNGSVSILLNNGSGSFGAPTAYSTGATGGVFGLDASDINGDGKMDVLASHRTGGGKVAIFTGNGDGTLGAATLFGSINNAVDVNATDFTGDGKPDIGVVSSNGYGGQNYAVLTNTTVFAPPLPTQTLAILGGSGNAGDFAANVEYYNPATGQWQPAYLANYAPFGHPVTHPWGNVPGTTRWINYRALGNSDADASGFNPRSYLYRVRFTVPTDAIEPKMTFSLKADNYAQVAINGVNAGGLITGAADQLNVDAVFSQNVMPGENTITLTIIDTGGLNGFNFRIDLSMKSSQPLEIVPVETDKTAPIISVPSDVIAEATSAAGAVVTFSVSANDNKDGPVPAVAMPSSGGTFPLGTTAVGVAASDAAGNTATAEFDVIVVDTTPPVVTAPANITAEATSAAGAAVSYSASATDIVDGSTAVTGSPASGSTFPLGTTSVALSSSDSRGNTGGASFSVTVQDTTAPALTVPANQVLEATGATGAVATFAASATDAVGVVSLTSSAASGSTFPIGTTTVTVTATDAAGNATSGSFTVTVRDTTAPAFLSLTPSTGSLWPPNHKMVAVRLTALAGDVVGITSLKIVGVTSSEPDNGLGDGDTAGDIQVTGDLTLNLRAERGGKGNGRTYTITVEARDAAGNATTRTTTVSVPKSQGK